MQSRFEQARINQLISLYSPDDPPQLALDFGDYLSLLWRLDNSSDMPNRERYYRQCALALGSAIGPKGHSVYRLVESTRTGQIYAQLPNLSYRTTDRHVDAQDRKAALAQLMNLRSDTLRIGTYNENWMSGWPGGGILDTELRERVFAVLFTALQGQYSNFGRLLLVIDIVIGNLIFGFDECIEMPLNQLISGFGYPDPRNDKVRKDFLSDPKN